jgi:hypothetical protein
MKLNRHLNAEGAEVAETYTPRRCAPPLFIEGISGCPDPLYEEGCPGGRGV